MSIIYDALKKVEISSSKTPKSKIDKESKPKLKIYLLFILILCLGFFIANIFLNLLTQPYRHLSKGEIPYLKGFIKSSPKDTTSVLIKNPTQDKKEQDVNIYRKSPKETSSSEIHFLIAPEAKKLPQDSLVLNGIFFSEGQSYALINNRILKEGDIIDGATVTRITLDTVELESQGSIIKLSTGAK